MKGGEALLDIVQAPLNIAINAINDIFKFGDPKEPFRLSKFITDVAQSVVCWFGDNFSWETIKSKISVDYKKLIEEIQENSSIQIILETKNNEAILELLNELIAELKELNNLKKIESLEKKLINNLDENSYSELIKLKNQINRE